MSISSITTFHVECDLCEEAADEPFEDPDEIPGFVENNPQIWVADPNDYGIDLRDGGRHYHRECAAKAAEQWPDRPAAGASAARALASAPL